MGGKTLETPGKSTRMPKCHSSSFEHFDRDVCQTH